MVSKSVVLLFIVINIAYVYCRPGIGLKPENDRTNYGSQNPRRPFMSNDNDMYFGSSGSTQQTIQKSPTKPDLGRDNVFFGSTGSSQSNKDVRGKNDDSFFGSIGSIGSNQPNKPQAQPNTSGGRESSTNDKNNDKLSNSGNMYLSNNNAGPDKHPNNQQSNDKNQKPENDRTNLRSQFTNNDNDDTYFGSSGSAQPTTRKPQQTKPDFGGKNDREDTFLGSTGSNQSNQPQAQPNPSGGRDPSMHNDKLSNSDNNISNNDAGLDKYSNNQQSNDKNQPSINNVLNEAHLIPKPVEEMPLNVPHHELNLQPATISHHVNDMVSSHSNVGSIVEDHIPVVPIVPVVPLTPEIGIKKTFTEKIVLGAKNAVDKAAELANHSTITVAKGIKKAIHSIATNPIYPLVRPEIIEHHLEMSNVAQAIGSQMCSCQ